MVKGTVYSINSIRPIHMGDRMESVQKLCSARSGSHWLFHFDPPAGHVGGLGRIGATIALAAKSAGGSETVNSTAYNRRHTESRPRLFGTTVFDEIAKAPAGTVHKVGPLPASTIKRITKQRSLRDNLRSSGNCIVHFHNSPQLRVMDDIFKRTGQRRETEYASTGRAACEFDQKSLKPIVAEITKHHRLVPVEPCC